MTGVKRTSPIPRRARTRPPSLPTMGRRATDPCATVPPTAPPTEPSSHSDRRASFLYCESGATYVLRSKVNHNNAMQHCPTTPLFNNNMIPLFNNNAQHCSTIPLFNNNAQQCSTIPLFNNNAQQCSTISLFNNLRHCSTISLFNNLRHCSTIPLFKNNAQHCSTISLYNNLRHCYRYHCSIT